MASSIPATPHTFVLIHGAWHGGWCWRDIAWKLQQAGHRAFAPTLTGLGERAHLASPDISFTDHVADIAAVLDTEELENAILVGHSFGGAIMTKVADLMPTRIRRLVFLDATIFEPGNSLMDMFSPENAETIRGMISDRFIAPPPAHVFGIEPTDTAKLQWLERRLTRHPVASWEEPLQLNGLDLSKFSSSYIYCTHHRSEVMDAAMAKAKSWGWPIYKLEAGHDPMITHPTELTEILLRDAAVELASQ